MKRAAILLLFIFAPLVFSGTDIDAQTCQCAGTLVSATHAGGDSKPLAWSFQAFMVTAGQPSFPPLMCYSKFVANKSDSKVLNVRWEIANYGRRFIPARDGNSSCPILAGELGPTPKSGPLNYGISSDYYDTTVHPPRDGWVQKTQLKPTQDLPPVRSAFQLDVDEKYFADIVVYSSVRTTDLKQFTLMYEVENRGNAPVRLLLNLPVVESMIKDLPFLDDFVLPSASRKIFLATVASLVTLQSATVVISDEKTKMGLAVDTVGVYAPVEGKRRYSDEGLFDRLR